VAGRLSGGGRPHGHQPQSLAERAVPGIRVVPYPATLRYAK
jgi:hypothetical protein